VGAKRRDVVLRCQLAGLVWATGLVALLAGCGKPNVSDTPAAPVEVVATSAQDQAADQRLPGRGEVGIEGRVNGPKFQVELARTEAERSQGLMFRRRLDEGRGMLFFMPGDDAWQFWMRNTYLRLDMVFIDADWRVVGVLANVPPLTEDRRAVATPSRYILELAGHEAARHGIVAGTRLQFRELPSAGTADAAR
jgi:hypothetical protein